ncbi:hypothetical protein C1H46_008509 [Malus baccata]|uniref:Uncharacterized protein n=1 Tax=Malus baccata TaxID=106549 RepID=A0A540N441_MALBA|nr:hypothetical protein C1H46_008509 [Malus baccata]
MYQGFNFIAISATLVIHGQNNISGFTVAPRNSRSGGALVSLLDCEQPKRPLNDSSISITTRMFKGSMGAGGYNQVNSSKNVSKAMSLRLRVSSMTDMSQGNDSSATQNNPEELGDLCQGHKCELVSGLKQLSQREDYDAESNAKYLLIEMAGDVVCYCYNEKSQTVRNEEEMAMDSSTSASSDGSRNLSCGHKH